MRTQKVFVSIKYDYCILYRVDPNDSLLIRALIGSARVKEQYTYVLEYLFRRLLKMFMHHSSYSGEQEKCNE